MRKLPNKRLLKRKEKKKAFRLCDPPNFYTVIRINTSLIRLDSLFAAFVSRIANAKGICQQPERQGQENYTGQSTEKTRNSGKTASRWRQMEESAQACNREEGVPHTMHLRGGNLRVEV